MYNKIYIINPLSSPCAGSPALKYGDVNTVTHSPGQVKGLNKKIYEYFGYRQSICSKY